MSLKQRPNWIAIAYAGSELTAWAMHGTAVLAQTTTTRGAAGLATDLATLPADWLHPSSTLAIISGAPETAPIAVPAKPLELMPQALHTGPDFRIFSLPGLSQDKPVAQMHGPATTIAGFLSLNPDWDGVLCVVGDTTHWVQISAGEVVSFQSFLTMSSYATLSRLSHLDLTACWPVDADELREAVSDAMAKPERLMARIAELGAGRALQGLSHTTLRSRLLGSLIGAELAAARPYWLGQNLALLADDPVNAPYVTALTHLGTPLTQADHRRMTLEGLIQGWKRLAGADQTAL